MKTTLIATAERAAELKKTGFHFDKTVPPGNLNGLRGHTADLVIVDELVEVTQEMNFLIRASTATSQLGLFARLHKVGKLA